MDQNKSISDSQYLQKVHLEDQKTIDELRKQNQYLRQTLKEYNATLSRCLAALGKNQKAP